MLAAFNHRVSLRRAGKRRHGQRGRSGESEDIDEPVRRRHQEPVERPGDPGMLHSEEGVPALRLGQVVSVNGAECPLRRLVKNTTNMNKYYIIRG